MSMTDEYGNEMGWCNACGEEGYLHGDCQTENCDMGEMEPYDEET